MSDHTKVGEILSSDQPRDAIHIAVASVIATEKLFPGASIGFVEGETHNHNVDVAACEHAMSVGIVDPFLRSPVLPGQRFWMFLHPNTITSLRHNWTHPAFGDAAHLARDTSGSERWLRNFLIGAGPDYDDLIAAVENGGEFQHPDGYHAIYIDGERISVNGADANGDIPTEFWDHVENVVGRKVPFRADHFSCSC